MFNAESCTLCGTCLTGCQWMDVTKEQAIVWQKAMIHGEHTPILDQCITCFACNERCPQGANPFDLHEELQAKYNSLMPRESVAGMEASYLFPGELRDLPRADRVLAACLYMKSEPELMQGSLYDLPRVGGKPFFCWGLFSHLGGSSIQKKHAQTFVDRLAMTGAKEVVCFHVDCYSMLACTIPGFGIKVPFRPVHLAEHLVEYLKINSKKVKPLNIAIAYQRPCASRHTPDMEPYIDELFDLTGARRVDRKYDRERALCCTSVKLMYNKNDISAREKNVLDAKEAGAQCLVYFCPVCKQMLAEVAAKHSLPLVFLGDIARMAVGEIAVPLLMT
jgi:Fe-S oxidoreductase